MEKATIQKVNAQPVNERDKTHLLGRLLYYMTPVDGRYDDLAKGNWKLNVFRDFTAGLIVAMVAIPLAMGFAMASGLRPEQGIVGGAVLRVTGQRTRSEARAVLQRLEVDVHALRGNPAAKRALWLKLRPLQPRFRP